MEFRPIRSEDISACVRVLQAAYLQDPWNEAYEQEAIRVFLDGFIHSHHPYALQKGQDIVALALCVLIPGIGQPYLHVEELCVAPSQQRKGYGSVLLKRLAEEAERLGVDMILLGTQKELPAYGFYLQNGYAPLEGSCHMYKKMKTAEPLMSR